MLNIQELLLLISQKGTNMDRHIYRAKDKYTDKWIYKRDYFAYVIFLYI